MPILAWTFSGKNTFILTKSKALIFVSYTLQDVIAISALPHGLISFLVKVKGNPNPWRKLTRGKQLTFLFVYCFRAKFSSRKRNITVLWKRLLIFECEGVLKLKKIQNNRGLVQRYQWSWRIHLCSRLPSNITVTTKLNSLNNNHALLQGFLGGTLFTTPGELVWSCH